MRLDSGPSEDLSLLNLTPLIDCMVFLLVFFLASTTFAKIEKEMDLDLPPATTGGAEGETHLLVINVRRDGTLAVEGRPITMEGLKQRLQAAAQRDRQQQVLIRGDTQVAHGVVMQVLDVCRASSLKRVAFGVRQPTEGGGR